METAAEKLKQGGIAVIPTDTIYGIVARAEDKDAVERVYDAKGRRPEKPCLILISSIDDLQRFDIDLRDDLVNRLHEYWPGKVSIILPCRSERLEYLHRGTYSLGFRLPDKPELISLLKQTGPLIAPSANPEGQPPAKNITEAKAYFDDAVNFYAEGETSNSPSKIISLIHGAPEIIRS